MMNIRRGVIKAVSGLRHKGSSSHDWMLRQATDPYVEKAKFQNYRCRSAFKLLEIEERAKFLAPGQVVVDIGASPGSWTQIAVNKVNSDGKDPKKPKGIVIAIDRSQILPIDGATVLGNLDFETDAAQERVKEVLQNIQVDVVLSDMAPNATGVRSLDQDKIVALCYKALRFAVQVSKNDATFLVKVWDGGEVPVLEMDLKRFYKSVKAIKPPSSRSDSSEKFFLARGFKGLQK